VGRRGKSRSAKERLVLLRETSIRREGGGKKIQVGSSDLEDFKRKKRKAIKERKEAPGKKIKNESRKG